MERITEISNRVLALDHIGSPKPAYHLQTDPWLPFDWPVQASAWGWLYGKDEASEIEWARAFLKLRLSATTPFARPIAGNTDPDCKLFCWCLNRIIQGVKLDQALQSVGYDPNLSKQAAHHHLTRLATAIPDYARVLITVELLYREITPEQQQEIKGAIGDDEMKAAYQLNMMCIDPANEDRTLLQLRHIGLKLLQAAEAEVSHGIQVQLADGRVV